MKPEFTISLNAAFRGQRDYLHSTDLYDGIVAGLKDSGIEATSFDLKMHDKITVKPEILFYRDLSPNLNIKPAAVAKFSSSQGGYTAYVSNKGSLIQETKQYDEANIWSKVMVNNNFFEVKDCLPYSAIEVVTSVGVFAHKLLFPPPQGARWLLAQISCNRLLAESDVRYFKLELARKLGPKLTQSNLFDKHGVFGKLIFILK
jgi:hypothetical protein